MKPAGPDLQVEASANEEAHLASSHPSTPTATVASIDQDFDMQAAVPENFLSARYDPMHYRSIAVTSWRIHDEANSLNDAEEAVSL